MNKLIKLHYQSLLPMNNEERRQRLSKLSLAGLEKLLAMSWDEAMNKGHHFGTREYLSEIHDCVLTVLIRKIKALGVQHAAEDGALMNSYWANGPFRSHYCRAFSTDNAAFAKWVGDRCPPEDFPF